MIANCRNGPLSANYDRKKNYKISQEKLYKFSGSRIAEKSHFLQITMARKTRPFLKKNHRISRDRELQKWATFFKLRSQEKLYNFSWSWIAEMGHILQITIVRKTIKFLKKNCTKFSWSRIAEKDHFLQITIARNSLQFLKKYSTISQEKLYNLSWSRIAEMYPPAIRDKSLK